MGFLVVGLNHRTAPLEVRERLAFSPNRLNDTLPELPEKLGAQGVVLLSTCNRTELYASSDNPVATRSKALDFIRSKADIPNLDPLLYSRENDEAVQHLFRVASGLDSLVVGEHEILGQVKQAYQ